MANSSEWIAEVGAVPQARLQSSSRSDWIAALAPDAPASPSGFLEGAPFATSVQAVEIEPSTPDSDHGSAEDDAFLRGLAEGKAEATRACEDQLERERKRFRDLRLAFRALDAAALEALAQDLSETVLALCRQVIGEYAIDDAAVLSRCQRAAERLGAGPSDLTLYLNPETRAKLDESALPGWTLAEDPALAPGSLRLTSADGSVRDGPEDWARAIAEALRA
ncbi:MAG: FliH/SctL family protein [Erythrobacter sp.]|uniref:FliH/SctL family protein n=1 Tax=Erythrobacter sp. TaxID=1042 RepID=UPI00261F1CCE|nr:FliH/SctL family protein [Erythrobacter sp.]MDJ0979139.1 FliH/SctL family protein [Erythrobacter sp.]